VHLDYANPYLNPFKEFQRAKLHPRIAEHLQGGRRISYGARALTEGGWQAIPRLAFPGGALIGCAAGFMNVPRIKGSHNAMLSGMMAAEAAFAALRTGRSRDVLDAYEQSLKQSSMATELKKVRNVKPLWSRLGTRLGVMLGGIDMWLNTIFPFLTHTLKHSKPDYASLEKAAKAEQIDYPKPDGVLSFDILSSVFLSGTNHAEDQPVHLRLTDPSLLKAGTGPITSTCKIRNPAAFGFRVSLSRRTVTNAPPFRGKQAFGLRTARKRIILPLKGSLNRTVRAFKTALWGL
jgi:electron-transferring-flavoprotein dehydrogenase